MCEDSQGRPANMLLFQIQMGVLTSNFKIIIKITRPPVQSTSPANVYYRKATCINSIEKPLVSTALKSHLCQQPLVSTALKSHLCQHVFILLISTPSTITLTSCSATVHLMIFINMIFHYYVLIHFSIPNTMF